MNTEVVIKEESLPVAANKPQIGQIDPMVMIAQASERGAGAEELGKLVDLFERIKAREDEMEFNRAKAKFQSLCPLIYKTKTGNGSKFAAYEDIMLLIQPVLTECGLTVDFNQKVGDVQGSIRVYCYVGLVGGTYRQENYMQSEADYSGNKKGNACQASASTTSYMQRYALKLALNLPIVGEDIDARLDVAALSKSSALTNALESPKVKEVPKISLKERLWNANDMTELNALKPEIEAIKVKKTQQSAWKDFHTMRNQLGG